MIAPKPTPTKHRSRDGANAGMNNLKLHAGRRKVSAAFRSYFDRALHVGLDDERKLFDVTRFELLVQLS